eukprot:jgi/Astpho2/2875/Aster-01029
MEGEPSKQVPRGINMSLDDLIKEQRQSQPQHRRGQGRGFGVQGGGVHKQQSSGRGPGGFQRGRGSQGLQLRGRGRGTRGGFSGSGRGMGGYQDRYGGPMPPGSFQQQQSQQANLRRQYQKCFRDEETGNVVFQYMRSQLVTVTPSGDVILSAADMENDQRTFRNHGTLNSFNDALKCLGIQVKAAEDADVSEGDWSVLDGKTLVRYRDGLVLAAKGVQHEARGEMLLSYMTGKPSALAAQAASTAAAIHAGVLPMSAMGAGGGFFPGGFGMQGNNSFDGGFDGGFGMGQGYGGRQFQPIPDSVRRARAQGRYY